jgi:hypothetical protein
MNYRFLASGKLAVMLAVAFLATVAVAGQGRSAVAKPETAAKAWTPSRTPDGQPDLQGFWTNATYTPLQRPNNITKAFYTAEEAAAIRPGAGGNEPAEPNPDEPENPNIALGKWLAAGPAAPPRPGSVADVHYDFSQFGLDRASAPRASSLRTSLIIDPPDGKIPPLTAEGQKRVADRAAARRQMGGRWDAAQNNELDDRCIIEGAAPPMLPTGYNSNYQIVQGRGYVMILVEKIHDARIIPLDRRPHVPKNIRTWMGDSRGHWEGETLVVETTNFSDRLSEDPAKTAFRGSGENLRVVERFVRSADDTILYTFTVEDPTTWTKPWSAEIPMAKTIGPLFEVACHEGNYSMFNALRGARAEEKKAAEEAAKKELK